jgi:hypothetical protein
MCSSTAFIWPRQICRGTGIEGVTADSVLINVEIHATASMRPSGAPDAGQELLTRSLEMAIIPVCRAICITEIERS